MIFIAHLDDLSIYRIFKKKEDAIVFLKKYAREDNSSLLILDEGQEIELPNGDIITNGGKSK